MHIKKAKLILLLNGIALFAPISLLAQNQNEIETRREIESRKNALDAADEYGKELYNFIVDSLQRGEQNENYEFTPDEDKLPQRGYVDQLLGLEDLSLPPLETFMASVYDNGSVKEKVAFQEQMEAEYRHVKAEWWDYVRFHAQYAYGYFYNFNSYYSDYMPATTSNAQHSWSIGADLIVPLGDLFGRKHKLRTHKAKIDQAIYLQEAVVEERKLRILNAYNSILENLAAVKPRAETVALYDANMKVSANDFINGNTSIIELSLERQRRSTAIVQYQQGRVALFSAVRTLELLTNIKIIKD